MTTIRRLEMARLLIILLVVSIASQACRARSTGPEQRYPIKGKVLNVDKRGSVVNIAHEPISGYMEAMTMPFKLKDNSLLNVMAEGDRVQATLVVAGARSWLEDVVVAREAVDQSNLSASATSLEPKTGDQIPDFPFVNQDGKRVTFNQYRGRNVVLTFIYTRCPLPDYCPLITEDFSQIETALKSDPAIYPKTKLLSISVDPEYDSPRVLREYAASHGADLTHWDFVSGARDDIKKTATYFGMQYWREGDQVIHSLRTALVSADGRLVKLYRGNEWKPDEIVNDLRNLATQDEALARAHRGVGVIESIDREGAFVQIDHEDIKDLMPAMNMPYHVRDKTLLDAVSPGDKVVFWLEPTQEGLIVVKIQRQ